MRLLNHLRAPETRQGMLIAVGVWVAAVPIFLSPSLTTGATITPWAWATFSSLGVVGILLSPLLVVATGVAGTLPRPWRLLLVVGMVLAAGALHGAVGVLLEQYFARLLDEPGKLMKFVGVDGRPFQPPLYTRAALKFLTFVWLHGLVAALAAVSRFHWIIRRQQIAMATTSRAKLEALRFQLNPHFLFNTLNVLSALILTSENSRADRLLGQLSEFLRATLVAPGGLVSLEQELAVVGSYLEIEGTRMGPRFEWEIDCPPSLSDIMVPSLVLLPLVEQAVADAMQTVSPGAFVLVSARPKNNGRSLLLSVSGRAGKGAAYRKSSTPDLQAVRDRIAAYYGSAATLTVDENTRQFGAVVTLPTTPDGPEAAR